VRGEDGRKSGDKRGGEGLRKEMEDKIPVPCTPFY